MINEHAAMRVELHQMAAPEEDLKRELAALAERRAKLERALEQRQQEIEKLAAEIKARGSESEYHRPPTSSNRDAVEGKLDQILRKLQAMETRLDRLDNKSPTNPDIEKALRENPEYKAKTSEIARLQENLANAEAVYLDKKSPNLLALRTKLRKTQEELMDLRKRLIPEIKRQLAEH